MGGACSRMLMVDAQTQCSPLGSPAVPRPNERGPSTEVPLRRSDTLRSMRRDSFRITSFASCNEGAEVVSPAFCQNCASKAREKSMAWLSSRKRPDSTRTSSTVNALYCFDDHLRNDVERHRTSWAAWGSESEAFCCQSSMSSHSMLPTRHLTLECLSSGRCSVMSVVTQKESKANGVEAEKNIS